MAKVLVIGAHGKVGQFVVSDLVAAGDTVYAGFRDPNQFEDLPTSDRLNPVLFDLTMSSDEMAKILEDYAIEQVVFTAGAGGKGGAERTTEVDLDGAVKAMEASEKAKVSHFVMVSAAGADDRLVWKKSGIYTYFMMKHYADRLLQQSSLHYTILRPTTLTDEAKSGRIKQLEAGQERGSVSRADVAAAVVASLHSQNKENRIVEFTAGDQPIDEQFK
ncbi:NAD(P)H-binding protein [Fructobacillus parabroussonetiae]|uniref:SDR family oxidoreductase n=1 Tax=Fructobacillus parabroussonetiae TaxID=2713174 RepID=A0ABS5QYZ3_9LACO|nr:NAD(P)H-binding protein [Fructobacillus parabroussonetiae]MBS9337499.1 SDR family oxidoreductase [Fructobacillus parabroussonetiae]MCK8617029.1 SDR family oxidoreductase [Fructobacillus parabroussonetiae]